MGSSRFAVVGMTLVVLVGGTACGSEGDAGREYADKLTRAGFTSVAVSPEVKKSLRKNRERRSTVAYTFAWRVNTDTDPATCEVVLRHPAYNDRSLRGDHWQIEEVDDRDVDGWGGDSPDPATVERLLREHHYDC
ncbi:hypothetical protein [Micromonospora sp. KC721]|uniref:hypothetical protein n=1 Tax=Micromonospora sp. KC721 TaxID=2530380 RepID=UPI0010488201|nr:hypothetical protein [Micromonospora sp. KC721]TDB82657.1 hypothetical protein E1182_00800 [Micromonospora sp. KC721]